MDEPRIHILIVDDEAITRDNLSHVLTKEGYDVQAVEDGREALSALMRQDFDLVLTDLRMKGVDGLEVLRETKRIQPDCEVIMITGYASVETAVDAIKSGAYHYLSKPIQIGDLRVLVAKALEKRSLKREIEELRRCIVPDQEMPRLVGQSPGLRALKETIAQVAQLDCTVLVLGETGTGKELVARTLHELSPRRDHRYIAVNCGAFSEELIANELFGHEKEAFTGAGHEKKGLIEVARGGTIFFDEIGELSLSMQAKLLRVLQEKTFMRLGGTREIEADVRVLAATNKDLKKEVAQGGFRQDLYYRLDVVSLRLPTLAERLEDIPALVHHFLRKFTPPGSPLKQFSSEAMEILKMYEYPGNVRELEHIVERALAFVDGPTVLPRHLLSDLRLNRVRVRREPEKTFPTLEEQEKQYILEVMAEVKGNKTKAAAILGIDRVSLWRKLRRYKLTEE
jgi:DNA-binding NtrC family response regulator